MNLHEYQGKEIFARYGIPVPEGILAKSPEAARAAAKTLGGRVVVKAQIHAGGRGKAGGVKLVNDADAAEEAAKKMLGTWLVTKQNGPDGQPVNSVWVEKPSNIERELYVSGLVDRSKERFVFMASAAGGMDIEEVAAHTPEKIRHITINPAAGLQPYQARQLGFFMGLKKEQVDQFTKILFGLYRIVTDLDASLIEINPLIVTKEGNVFCLDAKLNFDENALFRQRAVAELRDPLQEDERERKAKEHDLNYVTLDGDIGCMVNGAGLGLATLDMIRAAGGMPANFMDIRTTAKSQDIAQGIALVLDNPKAKVLLVNVFGGGMQPCDTIVDGLGIAFRQHKRVLPVVLRITGNNEELARLRLANFKIPKTECSDMWQAVTQAVAIARGRK